MTDDGKLGAFITDIRKGGPADRQAQLLIGSDQAVVVQRVDNAIHGINHYPGDSVVCYVNTYLPRDSDL